MSSSTSVQSISDEITVIENPKLPVVEYRVNKKTSSNVCKLFLLEFKDDVQTEWRKCIKCDALVKAPNSGTSGLSKHADSCAKSNKRKAPTNQPKIGFKKCPKLNLPKGMDTVSKLVYKDNIPITAVAKSEALQSMFRELGFGSVTYHSMNKALDEKYHCIVSKLKSIIESRNKEQLLTITFDKWTSQDGKKFIGIYLYVDLHDICLGLIPYKHFCGAEEIATYLRKQLALFGLTPSDITISVTDCGADVQAVSELFGWYSFPCLAHVVNLCVKRIICANPESDLIFDENDEDDEDQDQEREVAVGQFRHVIEIVRNLCKKVHSSTKNAEALEKAQLEFLNSQNDEQTDGEVVRKSPLKIICSNRTRWNSVFDMLVRFRDLKRYMQIMFENDLRNYDWAALDNIIELLLPFKECTMRLQAKDASVHTAKNIILYLQARVRNLSIDAQLVLDKWLNRNDIVEALLKKRGSFFDKVKEKFIYEENAQNDHGYNLGTEITLADFERRICADDFRVEAYMITFKPASVDPERLFSLCRYSKNYLQCRMTAAHHARNVFLKKNEKFL